MTFIDGFVTPVPDARKDEYIAMARAAWPIFKDYGATALWECWGAEVPEGKLTSFPMAVKLEPGETVVFSWIAWADKADRDRCHASMEQDPRWKEACGPEMPFDGKRMIFGGFVPVFSA